MGIVFLNLIGFSLVLLSEITGVVGDIYLGPCMWFWAIGSSFFSSLFCFGAKGVLAIVSYVGFS